MELSFIQAYLLTLIIETPLLYVLLRGSYPSSLIIRNSIMASTLTLPFVWLFFPAFGFPYAMQMAASESFAFGAEAAIYLALFPALSLRRAAAASLLCNLASFSAGLLLA